MSPPDLDSLAAADVSEAAALHARAFETFFLTSLGEPFLRVFYSGFVTDPDAVTVVTRDDAGHVVGLVVGTVAPEGFFRRLVLTRAPQLAVASLRAVARHPRTAMRILRGLAYRGQTPVETTGALLSSICVDPDVEHTGHGRRLIDEWWCRVQTRGADSAHLTTDADDNERVNDFYRKAGWTLIGEYATREGRRMKCYGISAEKVVR
ncbi:GNAT family N-acetyltransferase [Actinopolymorpha pittospori]|uniref:Ribosomal protein S18 acetylase RimI-like enzyme n=1 Tax=Actinopolymorpha pittospori TaxID=648752 RepID=A0A927MU14_9ACTN|nr:GNAT family N-acetyltransferase [Actinopolymorpha pittospori]MBE1603282.1 ribosomal protein S18 acetylase RimI-like enzyme [Actinopolymorpha pittospori]